MRQFARLYDVLEQAAEPGDRVAALSGYLRSVPRRDAAWALVLLAGRAPKRAVTPHRLRSWTCEVAGIPDWLFSRCRQAVADVAETATLLYPAPRAGSPEPLHAWIEDRLLPLSQLAPAECKSRVLDAWGQLDDTQLLVWNALLVGKLRTPVDRDDLARALAEISGREPSIMNRGLDALEPTAASYRALLEARDAGAGLPEIGNAQTHRLDAVLIYANRGRGRRAAYYCDLTFGLWREGQLVPFARTDQGLTEENLDKVDAFVRRHVKERFGPVRAVEPRLVFTIAFDGIETSARRKSGLKVHSPRVETWKIDAEPEAADDLAAAQALIAEA